MNHLQSGGLWPPTPGTDAATVSGTAIAGETGIGPGPGLFTIVSSTAFNIAFSSARDAAPTEATVNYAFPAGAYTFRLGPKHTDFSFKPGGNGFVKYWRSSPE